MDGGSEIQTIVIPTSPEMGSNDQSGSEDIASEEPKEEAPIPLALSGRRKLSGRPSGSKGRSAPLWMGVQRYKQS